MSALSGYSDALHGVQPFTQRGTVRAISGLTLELGDISLPVGGVCKIVTRHGDEKIAEVIGFSTSKTLAMPLTGDAGIAPGDAVYSLPSRPAVWCSDELLGRVLNGFGEPIDGGRSVDFGTLRMLDGQRLNPLDRAVIRTPISTSVRCIDALHTCGMGQRMGIFAGPGVGKSVLMAQIARYTSADVSVVALVGERGREVQEFVSHTLGPEGMKKCIVVASTGDEPPLMRLRAARVATTIAEYFRDQGKNVLLLVDSLTRMAQAQRQIGLAAGEPPATRGFPPSVFALIPQLLERAGATPTGSITGFYTVLVEGDDFSEPIADAVKGITDGHLLLSRGLAAKGHYPAIDVLQSISRVRGDVIPSEQSKQARRVLALCAQWSEVEDLVNVGAYVAGANLEQDLAVQTRPAIVQFLKQESSATFDLASSRKQLEMLCQQIELVDKGLKSKSGRPGTGPIAAARPG